MARPDWRQRHVASTRSARHSLSLRQGRTEEAQATVRRIIEIAPDTRIATLQERCLFANGLGIDSVVADLRAAGLPE